MILKRLWSKLCCKLDKHDYIPVFTVCGDMDKYPALGLEQIVWCDKCCAFFLEDYHCLGLNPPAYYSSYDKISLRLVMELCECGELLQIINIGNLSKEDIDFTQMVMPEYTRLVEVLYLSENSSKDL